MNLSYFRPFLGAPCSPNIYNSRLETPNLLDMKGFPDVRRSGVCAVHWRWPKWRGRASACDTVATGKPYFLKGGWNFCIHVSPMKMVFGMVCLQHASSATEALFVVSKMYHDEFFELTFWCFLIFFEMWFLKLLAFGGCLIWCLHVSKFQNMTERRPEKTSHQDDGGEWPWTGYVWSCEPYRSNRWRGGPGR